MNKQGLQEAASQNLQLYCKVVKLVKTSEIEIQPFDDLLILTVHLLLQFYEQGSSTERFSFLLIISSILETGLQHSPHSFQIKVIHSACPIILFVDLRYRLCSWKSTKDWDR